MKRNTNRAMLHLIVQVELDSIGQQVNEVQNIIQRRTPVQPASILEGLCTLNTNVRKIANQTAGISLDHIESGHQEAGNAIMQIQSNTQDLMNRIDHIKDGLEAGPSSSIDQGNKSGGFGSEIDIWKCVASCVCVAFGGYC